MSAEMKIKIFVYLIFASMSVSMRQIDYLDIDECDSSPCHHDSCTDGINEYCCACDVGYDGDDCENGKKKCFLVV